eukprot:m.206204 g.206204  ORF g.206204 m.206204 type:complete len:611 (-) comp23245_c0_seq1:296-2128(-)
MSVDVAARRRTTSSYAADFKGVSTAQLLEIYQHNLHLRQERQTDASVGHVTFDWNSEAASETSPTDLWRASMDSNRGPSTVGDAPVPIRDADVLDDTIPSRPMEDTSEQADEDWREIAREERLRRLKDTMVTTGNQTSAVPTTRGSARDSTRQSDIADDWVIVDVTEHEASLADGKRVQTVDTGVQTPERPKKVAPSKPKSKKKSKRGKRPPFALYGWNDREHTGHKRTFNVRAAADIDPASRRAGVRFGLLPETFDDTEVHEHAHHHAHPPPEDQEPPLGFTPVRTSPVRPRHDAPPTRTTTQTQTNPPHRRHKESRVRHESGVDIVPRLGLKTAPKHTAPPTTDSAAATKATTETNTGADVHDPQPSASARLTALLHNEAQQREPEWRTEYRDYYDSSVRMYPRQPTQQAWVYGAHAPAGPGVRRAPKFFDATQSAVQPYTHEEREALERAGVRHPKPWTGTSPGLWKPHMGPPPHATAMPSTTPHKQHTTSKQQPTYVARAHHASSAERDAPPPRDRHTSARHRDDSSHHHHTWHHARDVSSVPKRKPAATTRHPATRATYSVPRDAPLEASPFFHHLDTMGATTAAGAHGGDAAPARSRARTFTVS